jgi:SAM-dependent methyltransferase
MESYWDKRFRNEGHIWGDIPSRSAVYALELFQRYPVKNILVPGSGYGRHTKLFSEAGFTVTGIEISPVAVEMAQKYDPLTQHFLGSILDMNFDYGNYDAIYCFNVIHLFLERDRLKCLQECTARLQDRGLMFCTVFHTTDPSFGTGQEVEPDTFESKPGRPVHYYTENRLCQLFQTFEILESGLIEEPENHGGEPHTHQLIYILARKQPE